MVDNLSTKYRRDAESEGSFEQVAPSSQGMDGGGKSPTSSNKGNMSAASAKYATVYSSPSRDGFDWGHSSERALAKRLMDAAQK